MLAVLIGKNSIHKLNLPQIAIGDYWITDKSREHENKLLNIKGDNGVWRISSDARVKIYDATKAEIINGKLDINGLGLLPEVELKEYSTYIIKPELEENPYVLYCYPAYKENYFQLDVMNTKILAVGKDINSHIAYNNRLTSTKHTVISKCENKWYVENFDPVFGTFINNQPVLKKQLINNGDVIFVMGLKIIMINDKIYVNNPQNRVKCNSKFFIPEKNNPERTEVLIDKEPEEIELYKEEDYFSRAPRISSIIEKEKVSIDPPPSQPSGGEMPAFLVFGSSFAMGLMMMFSLFSTISRIVEGTASIGETISSILMCVAMLISMLLIPFLTRKWEKRQKEKYAKERRTKYIKYINSRIALINEIIEKQKNSLYENYLCGVECQKMVLKGDPRIWERKTEDNDFLEVRIGRGNIPLSIELEYPEKHFTMDEDNLVDILNNVGAEAKKLDNVPIRLSLTEKKVLAIIGKDSNLQREYIKELIMQLVSFHSYDEFKLVFFISDEKKWDFVKMLPHIWDNNKDIRFFADTYEDAREVSSYLEESFKFRVENMRSGDDYTEFKPYYLIITDNYRAFENIKILDDVRKYKQNIGFGLLCMDTNINKCPNECKSFINLEENGGYIFDNEISTSSENKGRVAFEYDNFKEIRFEEVSKKLSNIPIRASESSVQSLPENYTFLEMFDAGRIEQLNILDRWSKNDSTLSLRAPIGINGTGMPIILDIHEKYHGPHGLIAGSTGSGKSEFIITWILSLAINYHPDDLTFLLIDYKGGGLAGAFAKKDIKLPHLVGTITNIEKNGLQRSLDSIQSELRRRQVMFNKAREQTDESTIDIYKYQKLYHEGLIDEPIPHLLIICDEFAELKQQQEDFMEELISVSRIGRSLGVHLILATQKPAGIVNDQIRSNSKFGVCLKVQSREDSSDVIGRADASNLKKAGQFYINVGNSEYFDLGQSAYTGATYYPSDKIKKKIDTSLEFVSNTGVIIKKTDIQYQKQLAEQGDQLTNTVKYLAEVASKENISTKQLWLDSLPETIYLEDIREKYDIVDSKNVISPIIGEYDDPFNQRQGAVSLNLSGEGNTIVFGNAESGKETLINAVVYDTMTKHTADEAQFYLLDFGSEALKIFKNSPSVGDVVFADESEKIERLYAMLQKELRQRKKILSEYGGDYNLYLKTSGESMPMIIVVINNYEGYCENYEDKYEDVLQILTREGTKCGITFLITASAFNNIRYRLSQNFKQTIALQLNNEDDYYNIFEKVGKKRPNHIFGRGLVGLNDGGIYEFQTVKLAPAENWNGHIKEVVDSLSENATIMANPIPVVPDKISIEDVQEYIDSITNVPIGIVKKSLNIYSYDFTRSLVNLIISKNIEDTVEFITHLTEEFKLIKDVSVNIIDAERILQTKKVNISESFDKLVDEISKSKSSSKYKLYILIGMDKLVNEINEDEFSEMLENAKETEMFKFIFIENSTRIKNHEYDDWYQKNISNENGIWIGNGVEDQYSLSVSSTERLENNCGPSFGYVIKDGTPTLIKLVGVKEKGDDIE